MQSIVGYHGTNVESAKKIQEEKHYIPCTSIKEWLGKGVYFFEYDKHQAYMFIKFKKGRPLRHEEIRVLETVIVTPNDDIINLLLDEHKRAVINLAEKLKERIEEELGKGWGHPEGYVLDFMNNHRPYDVVIAPYNVPQRTSQLGFPEIQIQMCVKNNECIQGETIRSVNCDEYA